ncbi:MAG: cytochrome b N-terminal domain-containing protein [Deltaproteobacteria bacterium]|nr:cytochrome b N-terminal domain-containing protein [Deltaproteobacteria bacterium]
MGKKILDWVNRRLPLSEFIEKNLTGYQTPRNLNYLWNFGAIAGTFYAIQVISGIWLAMFYKPDANLAFDSIQYIMRDVHWGWLIRNLHATGSSAIFIALYIHMGRGLYYGSYQRPRELLWIIGFFVFVAFMAEAFMGYVLPWGQMSFWGATAITNVFTVIPVIGAPLTAWIRGDFAMGDATLTRFFALHTTLLPIGVIGALLALHLTALRKVGSNNPEGVDFDKKLPLTVPFYPYYITKDLWLISLFLTVFLYVIFFAPRLFLEPVNNEPANPLETPLNIVAEWYLLPFYAILKTVPSKLGGVIALLSAVLFIGIVPFLDRSKVRSAKYRPVKRVLTWIFFLDFILLGYVGKYQPNVVSFLGVEMHTLGIIAVTYYMLYFITMPVVSYYEPAKAPPGLVLAKEDKEA